MAETEQLVYIGGYLWVRVPDGLTYPTQTFSEQQVREAGGNPAIVRGPVISSRKDAAK